MICFNALWIAYDTDNNRAGTLFEADPDVPSGASTAAPYFVDRRLLQLIALCKLQMIDQSFDIYVFACV